jgi:two-component system response regulator PhoP
MHILVVEDEARLREQLRDRLRDSGHVVDVAADGEEGLYYGEEYPLDLAIIDIGLPKLSGIELIRRLRSHDKHFPILILTARGNWQDKVDGLETGADDYLVKPFRFEELEARLNALLRRASGWSKPVLDCGPISLDTGKQSITVSLYEQDYDRDSNVLEVFIGRLRRKLDPDNTLSPIETLRGRGYRFRLEASSG